MSLREEIKAYTDADGLVSASQVAPGTRNASGNGLLYTSLYLLLLHDRNELMVEDINNFMKLIRSCQIEPGLFKRGPIHPDQEGPDDLIALALASKELGLPIAKEILGYGRRQRPLPYVYNNVSPGSLKFPDGRWNTSAMMFRMQQNIAHFQFCAGERPPLWRRFWFYLVVWFSGAPRDQDSWLLSSMLIRAARPTFVMRLVNKRWHKRLKKAWPERGFLDVIAKVVEPDHPIVKYWSASDV